MVGKEMPAKKQSCREAALISKGRQWRSGRQSVRSEVQKRPEKRSPDLVISTIYKDTQPE